MASFLDDSSLPCRGAESETDVVHVSDRNDRGIRARILSARHCFVHEASLLDDEASFASGPPAGLRAQGSKAWRRCDEWSAMRLADFGIFHWRSSRLARRAARTNRGQAA